MHASKQASVVVAHSEEKRKKGKEKRTLLGGRGQSVGMAGLGEASSFWNFYIGLVGGHYWWQPAGAMGEFWRGASSSLVRWFRWSALAGLKEHLSTCGDIGTTLDIIYEKEGAQIN